MIGRWLRLLSPNILLLNILLVLVCVGPVLAQQTDVADTSRGGPSERASDNIDRKQGPALQHRNHRYQLHSADVLELTFPFTPEFNQTVTVQPDGFITLRGIDDIHVEGLTLPEIGNSLRIAYGRILHDPVINVALKDFEKPYFIVGGEVGHPGKFDLRGDTSVAQAVAIAGGLRDSAKHSEILLFHRVPDGWLQVKKVNLKKMLKDANLEEDAYLQPSDFLYVPKNGISKIQRFIPTSSLGLYANPLIH